MQAKDGMHRARRMVSVYNAAFRDPLSVSVLGSFTLDSPRALAATPI